MKSVAPVLKGSVCQKSCLPCCLICYPTLYVMSYCNGLQDFVEMAECATVKVVDCTL